MSQMDLPQESSRRGGRTFAKRPPTDDVARVAILGAGPVGVEAALYAATLGLPFRVFERGRVGEHLHQWGHVRLFSPFGMNTTPLGMSALREANPRREWPGDTECVTGREHLEAYLTPLAELPQLREHIHLGTEVLHIGRQVLLKEEGPGDKRRGEQPFRLLVRGEDGGERIELAEMVLDCTGTYSQPRYLGEGGIPAPGELQARAHISLGLEDVLGEQRNHYANRTTLVVGAGYSAATTVCRLATLAEDYPDTRIIWLTRGSDMEPIRRLVNDPLGERDQLAGRANELATSDGKVTLYPESAIEDIRYDHKASSFRVKGRSGTTRREWEVDRVVAHVGYTPNRDLYRELQVHECYASLGPMKLAAFLLGQAGADCLSITSAGPDTLRTPEPNFYILGAKSYGRNSNFLLKMGFEQVRDVFTLIQGEPQLDLYGGDKPPSVRANTDSGVA